MRFGGWGILCHRSGHQRADSPRRVRRSGPTRPPRSARRGRGDDKAYLDPLRSGRQRWIVLIVPVPRAHRTPICQHPASGTEPQSSLVPPDRLKGGKKYLLAVLQQAHQCHGGPQADSGWNEQTALAPPRISTAEAQRRRDPRSVHLGSINSNNWLPLLVFRKRLMADEVAPESSTSSVAPTTEASETTTARGIRKTACRPISAAKKQQILDLEPTGMSARSIARQVGTSTSTVKAVCRQAKQPPRRKRRFTDDDLRRAQQLRAPGRTYIEIGLELGFGRDTVPSRSIWRRRCEQPERHHDVGTTPPLSGLSCTVWVSLCFRVGFFVGVAGVGWLLWGTKAAVGSGG